MPSMWRAILPYVLVNVLLIAVSVTLLLSGHHKAAFVALGIDAANLMILRYKMFRHLKRDRP